MDRTGTSRSTRRNEKNERRLSRVLASDAVYGAITEVIQHLEVEIEKLGG
jgi:hypothetical protein